LPENWKKQFEISSTMFQEAGVAVAVVPEVKQKLANDNTTEAATTAKATSPKIAG
jgi:hypothetical protein